jgi:hypothetical protein
VIERRLRERPSMTARTGLRHQRMAPVPRWLIACWLALVATSAWAAAADQDIVVHVKKDGAEITVDVDCPVIAPVPAVWDVLTDYDNMTSFISNLEYSNVQARVDNVLRVHQRGKATRGPLSFTFDNVREVELRPFIEVRSRLNSGRYTPKLWVPPIIGPAMIEAETRKQFAEIRAEILRRSERRAAELGPR